MKGDNCYLKNICYRNLETSTAKKKCKYTYYIMNMEAATYICFKLGNNFEWLKNIIIADLSLLRIMQLSGGLDPHYSSQNIDSKVNANRICETQYNFHSSRTK